MYTALNPIDTPNNYYFGRTVDFSDKISPSMFFFPRKHIWQNSSSSKIINKYCFLGIGKKLSKVILTEGINEKGVSVIALYFRKSQVCDSSSNSQKHKIESLDMVNFLLGNCSNIEEAYIILKNTSIIEVKNDIVDSAVPITWVISDRSNKCLIVENTQDGLQITSNLTGILVNYTKYLSFMNLQTLTYYFKTYCNNSICYIRMTGELIKSNKLMEIGKISDLNKFQLLKDI